MEPIVFEPFFRPMVWGGRRLATDLGKNLPPNIPIGESWEISAHPSHVSKVASGRFAGWTLNELWSQHGANLAGADVADRFPWLIKFLDCNDWLSVQVHPNDALAKIHAPGETGKTEAWIILSAEPSAKIYAGLKTGVTRADFERALKLGAVEETLHCFSPKPMDVVFLPAGAIHAVGGGVLMAEVQQTSDATFRLHDWNRVGLDGKPRALHVEQALACIDFALGPITPTIPVPLPNQPPGMIGETLVDCPFFRLTRYQISANASLDVPPGGPFAVWMVLSGVGERTTAGQTTPLHVGDVFLNPATSHGVRISAGGSEKLVVCQSRFPTENRLG